MLQLFPMSFGWNSKFFTREKQVCLVGRDIKVVFHSRMSIRLDYQPLFAWKGVRCPRRNESGTEIEKYCILVPFAMNVLLRKAPIVRPFYSCLLSGLAFK